MIAVHLGSRVIGGQAVFFCSVGIKSSCSLVAFLLLRHHIYVASVPWCLKLVAVLDYL